MLSGSFAHHVNDFVSPGKLNCKFLKANLVKVVSASCGFDCAEIIVVCVMIVCQGITLIGKCLTRKPTGEAAPPQKAVPFFQQQFQQLFYQLAAVEKGQLRGYRRSWKQ